jgi:hypothetical protein
MGSCLLVAQLFWHGVVCLDSSRAPPSAQRHASHNVHKFVPVPTLPCFLVCLCKYVNGHHLEFRTLRASWVWAASGRPPLALRALKVR